MSKVECLTPCSNFLSSQLVGNATYAGISAAVMANVILIAYVAVAVMEDSQAGPAPISVKKQQ